MLRGDGGGGMPRTRAANSADLAALVYFYNCIYKKLNGTKSETRDTIKTKTQDCKTPNLYLHPHIIT